MSTDLRAPIASDTPNGQEPEYGPVPPPAPIPAPNPALMNTPSPLPLVEVGPEVNGRREVKVNADFSNLSPAFIEQYGDDPELAEEAIIMGGQERAEDRARAVLANMRLTQEVTSAEPFDPDSVAARAADARMTPEEYQYWEKEDPEYVKNETETMRSLRVAPEGFDGAFAKYLQTPQGAKRMRYDKITMAEIHRDFAEAGYVSKAAYEAKSVFGAGVTMIGDMWYATRDIMNSVQLASKEEQLAQLERGETPESFAAGFGTRTLSDDERKDMIRTLKNDIRVFAQDRKAVFDARHDLNIEYGLPQIKTGNVLYDYIAGPALRTAPSLGFGLLFGPAYAGSAIAASYASGAYNRGIDEGVSRPLAFAAALGSFFGTKYFGDMQVGGILRPWVGKTPLGNWMNEAARSVATGAASNFGQSFSVSTAHALAKTINNGGGIEAFSRTLFGDMDNWLAEAHGGGAAGLISAALGLPVSALNHGRARYWNQTFRGIVDKTRNMELAKTQPGVAAEEITRANRRNGGDGVLLTSREELAQANLSPREITSRVEEGGLGVSAEDYANAMKNGADIAVPVGNAAVFASRQDGAKGKAVADAMRIDPAGLSMAAMDEQEKNVKATLDNAEKIYQEFLKPEAEETIPLRLKTFRAGLIAAGRTRDEATAATAVFAARAERAAELQGVTQEEWLERKDVQLDFENALSRARDMHYYEKLIEENRKRHDQWAADAEAERNDPNRQDIETVRQETQNDLFGEKAEPAPEAAASEPSPATAAQSEMLTQPALGDADRNAWLDEAAGNFAREFGLEGERFAPVRGEIRKLLEQGIDDPDVRAVAEGMGIQLPAKPEAVRVEMIDARTGTPIRRAKVVDVDPSALVDDNGIPIDIKSKESLQRWLRDKYQGKEVEILDDGTIQLFTGRRLNASTKRRGDAQRKMYANLDALLESAVRTGEVESDSRHPKLAGQNIYHAAARIGNDYYGIRFKVDIQKGVGKPSYKDHKTTEVLSDVEIEMAPSLYRTESPKGSRTQNKGAIEYISIPVLKGDVNPSRVILDTLYQGDAAVRGSISFPTHPDAPTIIRLFKNSDISTVIHELNHLFVRDLSDMVADGRGGEQAARDLAALTEAAGGRLDNSGMEKIAGMWERYFMTGVAPSPELYYPFDQFRRYMGRVYKDARDLERLPEFSPEVRAVFDRMLATDAELSEARAQRDAAADIDSVFQRMDAAAAQRLKILRERQDAAERRRRDQSNAGATLKKALDLDAIRARIRGEVEKAPVFRAVDGIAKAGGMNRDNVESRIGAQAADELARRHGKDIFGGEVNPNDAAANAGFDDADAMLIDLAATPGIDTVVTEAAFHELNRDGDIPDIMDVLDDPAKQLVRRVSSEAVREKGGKDAMLREAKASLAEHPVYKAIAALKENGGVSRSAVEDAAGKEAADRIESLHGKSLWFDDETYTEALSRKLDGIIETETSRAKDRDKRADIIESKAIAAAKANRNRIIDSATESLRDVRIRFEKSADVIADVYEKATRGKEFKSRAELTKAIAYTALRKYSGEFAKHTLQVISRVPTDTKLADFGPVLREAEKKLARDALDAVESAFADIVKSADAQYESALDSIAREKETALSEKAAAANEKIDDFAEKKPADITAIAAEFGYASPEVMLNEIGGTQPLHEAARAIVEADIASLSHKAAEYLEGGDASSAIIDEQMMLIINAIEKLDNDAAAATRKRREYEAKKEAAQAIVEQRFSDLDMYDAPNARRFEAELRKAEKAVYSALRKADKSKTDADKAAYLTEAERRNEELYLRNLEFQEAKRALALRDEIKGMTATEWLKRLQESQFKPRVENSYAEMMKDIITHMGFGETKKGEGTNRKLRPEKITDRLQIPARDADIPAEFAGFFPTLEAETPQWLQEKKRPDGWEEWRDWKYGQVKDAMRLLQLVENRGRGELKALKKAGIRTRQELKAAVLLQLAAMPDRKVPDPRGEINKAVAFAKNFFGIDNLQIDRIFDEIDGNSFVTGKGIGLMRSLGNTLRSGEAKQILMLDAFKKENEPDFKILDGFTERMRKNFKANTFDIPSVGKVPKMIAKWAGKPTWDADMLTAVAFNMGNADNRYTLTEGFKEVDADGNRIDGTGLTESMQMAILLLFTKAELEAMQRIGDRVNALFPIFDSVSFRMTNRHLKKVAATPLTVVSADSETVNLAGWYYPKVFDPKLSDKTGAAQEIAQRNAMIAPVYHAKKMENGFIHERMVDEKGNPVVTRPILLETKVLTDHLVATTRWANKIEALYEFNQLVNDADVRTAIRDRLGDDKYRAIKDWLARQTAPDMGDNTGFNRIYGKLRNLSTMAALGWNLKSALRQNESFGLAVDQMAAASRTKASGLWYLYQGFRQVGLRGFLGGFVGHKSAALAAMHAKSEQALARSLSGTNKEISELLASGQMGKWKIPANMFFHLTYAMDMGVSSVVWHGAYEQARNGDAGFDPKGMSDAELEKQSIQYADAILMGQQSPFSADMTKNQASRGGISLFTQFMSGVVPYFAHTYGMRMAMKTGQIGRLRFAQHLAMTYAMPVLATTLVGEMFRMAFSGGDDDRKHSSLGASLAWGIVSSMTSPIPLVRDVPSVMQFGRQSAIPASLQLPARVIDETWKGAQKAGVGEMEAAGAHFAKAAYAVMPFSQAGKQAYRAGQAVGIFEEDKK